MQLAEKVYYDVLASRLTSSDCGTTHEEKVKFIKQTVEKQKLDRKRRRGRIRQSTKAEAGEVSTMGSRVRSQMLKAKWKQTRSRWWASLNRAREQTMTALTKMTMRAMDSEHDPKLDRCRCVGLRI